MIPSSGFAPYRNIFELKRQYPHCSYKMIARRIAEVRETILTFFINRTPKYRILPDGMKRPKFVSEAEWKALNLSMVYKLGNFVRYYTKRYTIHAYRLNDEPRFKKTIMLTQVIYRKKNERRFY